MSVRVACCQVALAVGEAGRNRGKVLEAAERAAREGAGIVVLPELSNSGYVFHDLGEAHRLAEPLDGPTVGGWMDLSRRSGAVVVGGLCEDRGGCISNTAVLVDPSGEVTVYRKAHLWGEETLFFEPGDEEPPVVETDFGRIGGVICYDLEFPEWVRIVALTGCDILCAPTNWPLYPRPAGERPMEVVRVQANAATNRIFIAACDRAGPERGVRWVEGSVIADPDGWPLAGPREGEGIISASCDLEAARDKRIGERNDVFTDRRPELYGDVVKTNEERRQEAR